MKLAEIMNRKDFNKDNSKGKKVNISELKKKEKECRKLQQELTQVSTNKMYSMIRFTCIAIFLYCQY